MIALRTFPEGTKLRFLGSLNEQRVPNGCARRVVTHDASVDAR